MSGRAETLPLPDESADIVLSSVSFHHWTDQSAQADRAAYPDELLAGMNRALCGHHLEGQFVTATYVYIDPAHHRVQYSNAGHPPPLLWRAGPRQITELTGGGVFLGFDSNASYPTFDVPIGRGDRLVLYTDGVVVPPQGSWTVV